MLFSPSDYNTQVPGLVFGPELAVKEVKPKVSSPSLPSKTFSRAKRERIRKGLIGERTLMKEEKKARRAARSAEKRLARGGDGERKTASKRVYRCKESVDATIRKVLGKTAKTKVAAKSEVKGEKVRKGTPGSNSSVRNAVHEARQERKLKGPMKSPTPSGGSKVSLFPQPDTSNVKTVLEQVTICDVGPEEWLEMDLPPANSQEEQVVLELSGPEQGMMEPMPPCMELFKVERLSVVMRCLTIAIYSFMSNNDMILTPLVIENCVNHTPVCNLLCPGPQ